MGQLFNRLIELNLGGTRIASDTVDGARNEILRVQFKIEKTLGKAANKADISVTNLAQQTRSKIGTKGILTTLEAGYAGNSSLIFTGKLEAGKNQRDGVNWISSFQSTDGGVELRQARINISFKSASVAQAFDRIVESLGVGIGNAREQIARGNLRGALDSFNNGLVLSGPTQRELDRLAKAMGQSWSIQDGQLQLLADTDAIEPNDAVVLNESSGMIGSPESGENGIVEVRSLLIPQLAPGRVVKLEARDIEGFYRVEKVTYLGDTHGNEWFADLELKPR